MCSEDTRVPEPGSGCSLSLPVCADLLHTGTRVLPEPTGFGARAVAWNMDSPDLLTPGVANSRAARCCWERGLSPPLSSAALLLLQNLVWCCPSSVSLSLALVGILSVGPSCCFYTSITKVPEASLAPHPGLHSATGPQGSRHSVGRAVAAKLPLRWASGSFCRVCACLERSSSKCP